MNPDQQVTIDLSATRGAEGFKATINITDKGEPVPVAGTTISPLALQTAIDTVKSTSSQS